MTEGEYSHVSKVPFMTPHADEAQAERAPDRTVTLRLYIAGESPNSLRAITNLRSFCQRYLPDRHSIEVIDTLEFPLRPLEDGILVTPTLVKLAPAPPRKVIGDLSDERTMRLALDLQDGPHG